MFRSIFTAAILWSMLCSTAWPVDLVGPDQCEAGGRPVRIDVTGLSIDELVQGQGRLVNYPRDGVEVWDAASWSGQPYCLFFADHPGKCLIQLIVIQNGDLIYAEHEIEVTGEGPDPPDPDPDPDPDPAGPFQVAFIIQSADLDNYTLGQQTAIAGRKFRDELTANGHVFVGGIDVDAFDPSGRWSQGCPPGDAPAKWKPWLKAVEGDSLPRVCLAPRGGGKIVDYAMPATLDEIKALIEKGKP